MLFSDIINSFGDEIFAVLNEKKAEVAATGKKIYNLSIGTPDFETPEHIRRALADAAMDSANWHYSLGDTPELLDAVCNYYKNRFGVEISHGQVASCNGSQEGMGHIGMMLCNKGDKTADSFSQIACFPAINPERG